MSPELLYWIALAIVVLPSVPFNRVAIVVLASWAFGFAAYNMGPFDNAACMFSGIVAFGAALGLSPPWDGSRRSLAQLTVAFLFMPTAMLCAIAAIYFEHPPRTMLEYNNQIIVYWLTWALMMLQAIAVPIGNDWDRIGVLARRIDEKIMSKIVKAFT